MMKYAYFYAVMHGHVNSADLFPNSFCNKLAALQFSCKQKRTADSPGCQAKLNVLLRHRSNSVCYLFIICSCHRQNVLRKLVELPAIS